MEDPGWREHKRQACSNNLTGASINQQRSFGRGEEANGSSVAWLGPYECLNMEISYITHKIKPITYSYLSYMERFPKIRNPKCQTLPAREDSYFEGISIRHSLLYKH